MKVLEEKYQSRSVSHHVHLTKPNVNHGITGAELSESIQTTVRHWADSVVCKKRMFVDALDPQIQQRKAKVSRLQATERDMEQRIDSQEKQVKKLLKKIGKFKYLLGVVEDLQEDLGSAEERVGEVEAQHGELEECQYIAGGAFNS